VRAWPLFVLMVQVPEVWVQLAQEPWPLVLPFWYLETFCKQFFQSW
jgi:hypothetical protein